MKLKENDSPIPRDPGIKRIPVRIDSKTVILVKEGVDIEAHRKRYLEREVSPPKLHIVVKID